ncbi:MAG: F0F1 ATP synthase subunit epsilon [Acidobacteriota bacterium]
MKEFPVLLHSSTSSERLEHVISFVGEDDSGSFGLLGGHARMVSCLNFGLARIRYTNGEVEYIALPGGLIYFVNNELCLATRQYFRSGDYEEMSNVLDSQLAIEEESLRGIRESLRRLDESILKRILSLRTLGEL